MKAAPAPVIPEPIVAAPEPVVESLVSVHLQSMISLKMSLNAYLMNFMVKVVHQQQLLHQHRRQHPLRLSQLLTVVRYY